MLNHIIYPLAAVAMIASLASCSQDLPGEQSVGSDTRAEMKFTFAHPSQGARVTDTNFETGDQVGLFVAVADAPLEIAGNIVNNEILTYNGTSWAGRRQLYWDEGMWSAYAYYPAIDEVSSTTDQPFSVSTDQSSTGDGQTLGGYESSDFLHASATGLTASADPVKLAFRHVMSRITVRLVRGEDYDGELPEDAVVIIHNTVPEATIDMEGGVATRNLRGSVASIKARKDATGVYSAIIVPQRLDTRQPLVEVLARGVSYIFDSKFVFKSGVNHVVSLVIDKNPDQLKIEIGGELTNWN
ncbi:MAG: fimbrillin family protein [Bacteroides sp.]|nr:fimbrillin family protein [Bacteroides sp.]